jgi:hypothetical protein
LPVALHAGFLRDGSAAGGHLVGWVALTGRFRLPLMPDG